MTTKTIPRLSKSRFQLGMQCYKALWLKCYQPELSAPVTEVQQAMFDTGHEVGELAQQRYPDGVEIAEDHAHSSEALETTRQLLVEGPPALFEAAFQHDGVFVRPDILVRVGEGLYDLIEVKSSTSLKPEHVTDVAVQAYVVEGSGLKLRRLGLLHLNNGYVYEGGEYDLGQLFKLADVTGEAREFVSAVPSLLTELKSMLGGACPETLIGGQCGKPYPCPFKEHCHAFLPPEYPITALPRLSEATLHALLKEGVQDIREIPEGFFALTDSQRKTCRVVQSGEMRVFGDLARLLAEAAFPLLFLDFETWAPALPRFSGTRPYQALAFQYSLHVLTADGELIHREYLHTDFSDPRRPLAERMLAHLGDEGSVVHYTGYETRIIRELADALPDLAVPLERVLARAWDLHDVVKEHVRHPNMKGRTSIKYVLPALVPEMSYEGMAIAEGQTASLRYGQAVSGRLPEPDRDQVFHDLREYCGLDTLAMVRLWEALVGLAGER